MHHQQAGDPDGGDPTIEGLREAAVRPRNRIPGPEMGSVLGAVRCKTPAVVGPPLNQVELIATLGPVFGEPDCPGAVRVQALRITMPHREGVTGELSQV